jgi:hypothetical protein
MKLRQIRNTQLSLRVFGWGLAIVKKSLLEKNVHSMSDLCSKHKDVNVFPFK